MQNQNKKRIPFWGLLPREERCQIVGHSVGRMLENGVVTRVVPTSSCLRYRVWIGRTRVDAEIVIPTKGAVLIRIIGTAALTGAVYLVPPPDLDHLTESAR